MQAYARASRGNLEMARALCGEPGLAERRQRYLRIGENLGRGAWEGGASQMAAEIMSAAAEAGEVAGQEEDETVPGVSTWRRRSAVSRTPIAGPGRPSVASSTLPWTSSRPGSAT